MAFQLFRSATTTLNVLFHDIMTPLAIQAHSQKAFSVLPLELFLNVLDQLVDRGGQQPLAYPPSHPVTKALRALTLVSREIYPMASRYLYAYCIYLHTCTGFMRFLRTLGYSLGNHPQALRYGESGRNNELFADTLDHISSMFISPVKVVENEGFTPLVRLPQIIDLISTIGKSLRRLAIDLQPIYATPSELAKVSPYTRENNIFLSTPQLEEIVASYNILDYFVFPPSNLRRLAITFQKLDDVEIDFCFSIPSLETSVFLRPLELASKDIDLIFSSYKGDSLDVLLVDINSNHRTPVNTRDWGNEDKVRIWEVDVPTSFYGDEDDLVLCDNFVWVHGVGGTLWNHGKRRMASWSEIERRLAGPVHLAMNYV